MKFLSNLLKRWYFFLPLLLILPGAAVFYGNQRLDAYQSQAYLYVQHKDYLDALGSQDYNTYQTPAQNEASFMAQLMQSQSFMVSVAKVTNLAKIYDLNSLPGQGLAVSRIAQDVTITPSTAGPNGLTISVKDKDPVLCQQLATALIQQFNAYDAQRQIKSDSDAITYYQNQLESAKADATADSQKVADYLKQHPNLTTPQLQQADAEYTLLASQVTQDQETIATLQETIQRVQLDMSGVQQSGVSTNLDVLDPPSVAKKAPADLKQLIFYGALGLLAALVLIALGAGIPALINNKVESAQDVKTIFDDLNWDAPVIETVPTMPKNGRRARAANNSKSLVALLAPEPVDGERES